MCIYSVCNTYTYEYIPSTTDVSHVLYYYDLLASSMDARQDAKQEWLDGGVKKIESLWAGQAKRPALFESLFGSKVIAHGPCKSTRAYAALSLSSEEI